MSKRILTLFCWKLASNHGEPMSECRTISYSVQNYYKSKYSIDQLYPNSSLNIAKPPQMPQIEKEKFSGLIPMDKLTVTYSVSPTETDARKVPTKVEMKFHVNSADWIPEILKPRLLETFKNLVNKEGWLVLHSDRTNSQMYNVADGLDKLRFMIRAVEDGETTKLPTPHEFTIKWKQHEQVARERLRVKKTPSDEKQSSGATDL